MAGACVSFGKVIIDVETSGPSPDDLEVLTRVLVAIRKEFGLNLGESE